MGVENVAASQEMSIAVYNSKADCDAAANMNWKSANTNAQELNFSCDSVDTAALVKTDAAPVSTLPVSDIASPTTANTLVSSSPLAPASAPAPTTPAPVVAHGGGGGNPMMWYILGNVMNNRSGAVSSGLMPASTGVVAPNAYINSTGKGNFTMSAAPQFASPSTAQYAGLKANGGIVKTGMIGSNLAHAASYNAAKSSIASKSSVGHSSVGHSSGGHGGGGGGGGG